MKAHNDDAWDRGLDPEVAALARAAKAAADADRTRPRTIIWEAPGEPVEMKLKFSATLALCTAAGLLSAIGALFLFSWPKADFSHLVIVQLPAAALIATAFARARKKSG